MAALQLSGKGEVLLALGSVVIILDSLAAVLFDVIDQTSRRDEALIAARTGQVLLGGMELPGVSHRRPPKREKARNESCLDTYLFVVTILALRSMEEGDALGAVVVFLAFGPLLFPVCHEGRLAGHHELALVTLGHHVVGKKRRNR